jgi:hypothetical protein
MKTIKKSIFLSLFMIFSFCTVYGQWSSVNSGTSVDLLSIAFSNNSTGYCVGDSGVVLKSNNGGKNWGLIYSDSNIVLGEVFIQNNKVLCYGASSDSTYVKITSFNNGGFWSLDTISYFPLNGKIYNNEIYFIEDSAGINILKKITSSGAIQSITDSLIHFDVNADGIVTFYHVGGTIVLKKKSHTSSTWQYLNFTKPNGLTPNSYTWSDFRFFGDSIILKASYPAIVVYSFDNGVNWNDTSGNGNMPEFNSYIFDPYTLYGMDNFNRLQYSINTGANWNEQDSLINEVNKFYFLSADTGFICGKSGMIYQTVNGGGTVGIKESLILNSIIKIYPNPAKGSLHIEKLEQIKIERLFLMDISGKVVRNFNRKDVSLDVSGLSRGNYLLQIVSKEGQFAKKVVLK